MSEVKQNFNGQVFAAGSDPEVVPMPKRRRYSREYKLHILAKAERCQPGELGAMLRQEGIYSSTLSRWRQQKEAGKLGGRVDQQKQEVAKTTREFKRLQQENARLRAELAKKEAIIEVQKKLSALLAIVDD